MIENRIKNLRKQKAKEQNLEYKKYLREKGQLGKDGRTDYQPEKEKHKGKINHVFVKGVYFLKFKGQIVYVGMSTTNCMNRINAHWNDNNKIFDSFSIVPCHNLSIKQIAHKEKMLIKQYRPTFNVVHNK